MHHLYSIESGELWFTNHFDPIIACIGSSSLLVMYYPRNWLPERIVDCFNEAYRWLHGHRSDSTSPNGGIKFAAREELDGSVTVHQYIPGDWAGYVINHPLATCKRGGHLTDASAQLEKRVLQRWIDFQQDPS